VEALSHGEAQGQEVVVAQDAHRSSGETAHLLRSPANARRVLAAIDRLERGGGTIRQPTA
jgi:antitoxin YefM